MRGKFIRVTGLAVTLTVVAAACGSDENKDDATAAPEPSVTVAASPTSVASSDSETGAPADIKELASKDPLTGPEGSGLTRGVTATEIKVGCVVSAKNFAGAEDGYRARFERANREGGINGRQIALETCEDDNVDHGLNLSLTKRLVDQEEVFAMVGLGASAGTPSTDFTNENQVPYVAWATTSGFCGNRWTFGFNGCLIGPSLKSAVPHPVAQGSLVDAIIEASGLDPKDVRFAGQAADDEAGRAGNAQFKQLFEARGATVVYSEASMPLPGPTTDYTPYVQKTLASDPNIVYTATQFGDVGGFSAALKAAGYEGVNMNFVAYVPGLLDSAPQLADALEGTYVNTQIVPQEEQTPYIKQIESDLTAIEAKSGTYILFGTALAYVQADMLVQMLTAAGKDLNTKTFDEAVNGGAFTYTSLEEGGPGAISFPEGHFLPADCAAIMKVENKKYTIVVPFKCYPSIPL